MNEFNKFCVNRPSEIENYDAYQSKLDEVREGKTPRWVKIISIILLIALGLSLAYVIFVHPINKLKLRFLIYDSFTLEIIIPGFGIYTTREIQVDGNIMKYGDQYYEIDGNEIYTYHKNFKGEWQKIKSDDFNDPESTRIAEKILKRSNYRHAKGRLFAWKIKDNVDLGNDIQSAGIELYEGKIAIVLSYRSVKGYMHFTDFGKVKLTPPWEEQDK